MKINQIKKGDILPCGGVVFFVGPRAYMFRDKRGVRHTVEIAAAPAVVIDYVALAAAQDAVEAERNRPKTDDEIAAYFAAVEKSRADNAAAAAPIEAAALSAVPDGEKPAWLANLAKMKNSYGEDAITSVAIYGNGHGHTVRTHDGWAWDTCVITYDGGGSGYGRHAD